MLVHLINIHELICKIWFRSCGTRKIGNKIGWKIERADNRKAKITGLDGVRRVGLSKVKCHLY